MGVDDNRAPLVQRGEPRRPLLGVGAAGGVEDRFETIGDQADKNLGLGGTLVDLGRALDRVVERLGGVPRP